MDQYECTNNVHKSLKLYAILTIMTQIIICVFDDHFEKLPLWRRDQKLMWNNIKHVLCKLCCYWNAKTVLLSCSVLISRPIPQWEHLITLLQKFSCRPVTTAAVIGGL